MVFLITRIKNSVIDWSSVKYKKTCKFLVIILIIGMTNENLRELKVLPSVGFGNISIFLFRQKLGCTFERPILVDDGIDGQKSIMDHTV